MSAENGDGTGREKDFDYGIDGRPVSVSYGGGGVVDDDVANRQKFLKNREIECTENTSEENNLVVGDYHSSAEKNCLNCSFALHTRAVL